MKAILLVLALALSTPAWAGPHTEGIANMRAWCDCVMVGGVCRVTNGPPAKPGARTFTSAGVFSSATYNKFRDDPMMCQRGAQACTADWMSEQCVFFRGYGFRQEPIVCVRPGEPVLKKP